MVVDYIFFCGLQFMIENFVLNTSFNFYKSDFVHRLSLNLTELLHVPSMEALLK